MNDSLLVVHDLYVHFPSRGGLLRAGAARAPIRAVDGISFDVRRGEVLAVVGESGCGKTTLGKALTGLIRVTGGTILYDGEDLRGRTREQMHAIRRRVQSIFQDPYESLDPRQSVYDAVVEPLLIHEGAAARSTLANRVHASLEAVGLRPPKEIALRYPHLLSGGQRQRVSIAAAMILGPEFIVADEPVSMLDVSIRAEIIRLMLELRQTKRLTYLFITHDLSLAWMIADRIMVLYLGQIMELGPAERVIHHACHPYTRALVSVVPAAETRERGHAPMILKGETPSARDIPPGCRFRPRCWMYQQMGQPGVCEAREPELAPSGENHLTACHFANGRP